MLDCMVIVVSRPSGFSGVRSVEVSLPLVRQLLEAPSRYRLPSDAPKSGPVEPVRSRGPSFRTLVKAALDRESGLRR